MRLIKIFEKILVEIHEVRIAIEMLVPENTVLKESKPKRKRGWTKADEKKLVAEINDNKTYKELERIFGRTRASIQSRASDLRKKGIKVQRIKG